MSLTLARRMGALRSSAIRDLLTVTARPDVLSLAGGLPDPELVPHERIRQEVDRVLGSPDALQYTETAGWFGLREVVAARETGQVAPDEVVITHGSQQALSLLAQVLLDPGASVVVEEPAYPGALQVFRAAESRVLTVPLDVDGMRTDRLEALLDSGERPVLVHTVSNFHNPRGATMTAARRAHLAGLAERFGFWVLEDDPYGELYYDGPPPEPVATHSDRVIRLSSASKILAPALRVGWLRGPREVCAAVELVKQGADLCGSSLIHQVATGLLTDGPWLDAHLTAIRAQYGARATALHSALVGEFGDAVEVTAAAGGMFGWVEFRDGTDTDALLRAAVERRVAFVPGSAFAVDGGHRHGARVCFTTNTAATLEVAVERLAEAHRTLVVTT
ncbi:PLP-dependent aminotransferase family protein [Rhodococcus spelaei]|uniref:PLP-dependent aminotransferase family protein n=1 Tax=Rhodococcus spelaei TaxID=2546320 RepID=A0A541B107_9NOCA|nr:PLP-dependent aminotransferase family protein [Rhodococcus spelaei]TQF66003.1 PLP-dependent aminotransferase family protein [Rhodococcus spelaei]